MFLKNIKQLVAFFLLVVSIVFFIADPVSAAVLSAGAPCNIDTECASGKCVPAGGQKVCKDVTGVTQPTIQISFEPPTSQTRFSDLICAIINFLKDTILPPIAVLMALVVGFLFLTSQGDPGKIKTANKMLLFTVIGVVVILVSPGIVALVSDIFGGSLTNVSCGAGTTTANIITSTLVRIINWFAWVIAVVSVAMALYSAFLFITSSGQPEKTKNAKKTFLFTIIGVVVAIVAFSIIRIVESFL